MPDQQIYGDKYFDPNDPKNQLPPKKKTEGEKLEESGDYIDSGEGTDAEGNLLKSTAEGALWGLQKYGEGIDWTNKQVNLRNALMMNPASRLLGQPDAPDWVNKVLDYSFHDLRGHTAGGIGNVVGAITGSEKANDWAELAGQILLPDAIDFATGGVGYLDNIGRAATKLRKVDGKMAQAIINDVFSAKRFEPKQVFAHATAGADDTLDSGVRAMTGSGTGGARAMSGGAEEGSRQWGLFNRGGIRDSTYDHWKYKDEGWMSSNEARKTLEAYQTGSRQYVPGFFEAEGRRLRPGFIEEYGDYMVRNGLSTTEDVARGKVGHNLELHHITPLKASAPLYHNTNHGDEAWTVVTDVFNKHGLFPGQGLPSPIESVSRSNYFMALKEPHNILHNNFLMDLLGRDGSTFFTPARMEVIESGLEGRRLVAEEYALHIKQGQAILEDGMKQMEALFSKSGVPPEELADLLSRASNAGELKILDTDLMVRSVNDQLKNIAEEASWEDYGTALGDEVPEVLQRHIDKAVQSFYTRVMKQYGLSGKGGLGKPPIQL